MIGIFGMLLQGAGEQGCLVHYKYLHSSSKKKEKEEKEKILTITAHEGVCHGLVATVGEGPVPPAVMMLPGRQVTLVPFALPRADADDPVHQLALGLLLLQVVVLSDAVDELADLVGLAGEGGIGGALGQLVNLMQGVKLQQLLGDQRVNVFVALLIQVVVLVG